MRIQGRAIVLNYCGTYVCSGVSPRLLLLQAVHGTKPKPLHLLHVLPCRYTLSCQYNVVFTILQDSIATKLSPSLKYTAILLVDTSSTTSNTIDTLFIKANFTFRV